MNRGKLRPFRYCRFSIGALLPQGAVAASRILPNPGARVRRCSTPLRVVGDHGEGGLLRLVLPVL